MVLVDGFEMEMSREKVEGTEKDVDKGKEGELDEISTFFAFELSFRFSPSTLHLFLPP